MKQRYPAYYSRFSCVGGDCPDTCCRDWEVVLDNETASFYRAVPGALGQILRRSMVERDGEVCFCLQGGRCPLLDEQGLCRIQLAYGPEKLSHSCDMHPRFAEEYGALREWSLSMGCPEAARLLLTQAEPTTFCEVQTSEPPGLNDLDARLFYSLLSARKAAIAVTQDRSHPWAVRRARLLAFADALQRNLNQHRISRLQTVTARFSDPFDDLGDSDAMDRFWPILAGLEAINSHWPDLLASGFDGSCQAEFEAQNPELEIEREHLVVYYLYRYFLKAVVDRQVLARVRLAVYSADAVGRLELAQWRASGRLTLEDRIDILHRYSREVEHSQANMAAILAALQI